MYGYLQYKKVILAGGFMRCALSVREWGTVFPGTVFLPGTPATRIGETKNYAGSSVSTIRAFARIFANL
jgi:hypothetical protein